MKIKKTEVTNSSIPIPNGFKQTDIGLIPEDWEIMTIGDVFKFTSGKSRPKNVSEIRNGKNQIPVYGGNGILGYSDKILLDRKVIILGRVGEYCGCAHLSENFNWISDNALYTKEIKKDIVLEFMKEYLGYLNLNKYSNKMGQPLITQGIINRVVIALPHKNEQKKIAHVLSKIQQAIETQEQIIKTTQELKKVLMQKLFTEGLNGEPQKQTEIGPIPESWEVKRIDEVYIFTRKPRNRNFSNYKDIPFIPMDLIPDSGIEANTFIPKNFSDIPSGTYFENGDLLLAKITPSFENGKQGIAVINFIFGYATTEVIPIKSKKNFSDILFLHHYLKKEDIRKTLAGKMEGSTGRQRLPKGIVQSTLIPFPDYKTQKEISSILARFDLKIEYVQNQIKNLKELFKNSLNKLMTGQIRVKDIEFKLKETAEAVEGV